MRGMDAEMCSGSEAGPYLRRRDFVYHSTLGLKVIKKKKDGCRGWGARRWSSPAASEPAHGSGLRGLAFGVWGSGVWVSGEP